MKFIKQINLKYKISARGKKLDLSHYSAAKEWAYENVNDLPEEGDSYREITDQRISDYVDKYHSIKGKPSIEIYRAVSLDKIEDLDLKAVGTHWSFEKEGTGTYGLTGPRKKHTFVLIGKANPKDIDWEYGFTSFLYYGTEQWECALETGSQILITHIDGKKLEHPLKGKV